VTDQVSRRSRSRMMAKMPRAGTRPELRVAAILAAHRVDFTPQVELLLGRGGGRVSVDFFSRKERLAIFVDGCFVHGCTKHKKRALPARWKKKIAATKLRDRQVHDALVSLGWRVLRLPACEIDAGRIAAAIAGARRR